MATRTADRIQPFTGFPGGGYDFFLELQAKQSRDWFRTNKLRYEQLWEQPMRALIADLATRLRDVFPTIQPEGKIFRIYRDTRFSLDKSPFKTHIAAHILLSERAVQDWSTPGFYLHFGLEDNVAALGRWMMSKEAVAIYRQAVAEERTGAPLQRLFEELEAADFHFEAHEALKRVPPPFAQDHPRAGLLRLKGLAVSTPEIPEELLQSADIASWISDQVHRAAPIVTWLQENVPV